ncbi:ElyC/SanA/YdcF family protein [Demequina maris]|uniref:ElyC/SanA/YdcF family protein n=1 Tax=Demequina maris TaxID=1638982 RepID=UPI0012E021C8|nr:ElyC/SanA/YdcF family protein [Demequina maris]
MIAMLIPITVFVVASLLLYVYPAHDEPGPVDAVFVIGPPTDGRIALAQQMIAEGDTDTLVVSIHPGDVEREYTPMADTVCTEPQPYTVICGEPDPFTTAGEAAWIRDLATENGWESVGVITFTPHLSRTRVIMERCWDGDLRYLDSQEHIPASYMLQQAFYQTAGFLKVAFRTGC